MATIKLHTRLVFLLITATLATHTSLLLSQSSYTFEHLDVDDGLSYGVVYCIYRDSRGLVWIGTDGGLNLYDGLEISQFSPNDTTFNSVGFWVVSDIFEGPEGELWMNANQEIHVFLPGSQQFEEDIELRVETYGLPSSNISRIVNYKENYWFLLPDAGVVRYNKESGISQSYSLSDMGIKDGTISLSSFDITANGDLWLVTSAGQLFYINDEKETVIPRGDYPGKQIINASKGYKLFVDKDDDLWVYPTNGSEGIIHFDIKKNSWSNYHTNTPGVRLNNNLVRDVTQDQLGRIWIGTDHGGINVIDKKEKSISYIIHDSSMPKGLVHNSVLSLYSDREGIIWAGTYKNGVNYYHPDLIKFDYVHFSPSRPNSLPFNDVNQFVEDKNGLWIGTNGEGLIYFDRKKKAYKQYKNEEGNPNSLSSDVIVSMLRTSSGELWIGTFYGGLNKYDKEGFTRFLPDTNNKKTISGENVWAIFEDSKAHIWVSTLTNGLSIWKPEEQSFHPIPTRASGLAGALNLDFVYAFAEDNKGNIWVGGGNGIEWVDPYGFKVIEKTVFPELQAGTIVTSLHNDNQERMWIGSLKGLYVYEFKSGKLQLLTESHGLPSGHIQAILQDNLDDIWVSTTNGISRISYTNPVGGPPNWDISNFDISDGLQGTVFNRNSALKLQNGQLIFGGPDGFNIITPDSVHLNRQEAQIILTDIKIRNKSILRDEEKNRDLLFNPIMQHQALHLKHFENIFTIDFASLNYLHPHKNEYEYYLEGFESSWKKLENAPSITYMNMPHGDYIFKLRASNNDGKWSEEGIQLPIVISPPFWKTNWAYFLYILLIAGALYLARQVVLIKERANFLIQQERRDAQNLEKLNQMKMHFFTNISHELRTPITLILAPLDNLRKLTDNPLIQKHHQVIRNNANNLLRMVDQLLDIRKLDLNKLEYHPVLGDIISFIAVKVKSFEQLAESKNIKVFFYSSADQLLVDFDADKMEKILYNLLSNALKFTPKGGMIRVELSTTYQDSNEENYLIVKVIDNGIGISEEEKGRIFERFYNTGGNQAIINHGSGIGLSIVSEFVKLHKGHVEVESSQGKGSNFSVFIPYSKAKQTVSPPQELKKEPNENKKLVLVIEDNFEFKNYLIDNLAENYNIISASNGKEGWQLVLAKLPDIIVSDLMMPIMNGIRLCQKLKSDARTAHIPIILFTANPGERRMLEGFEQGADDYFTKPFSFDMLNSRIKNLIEQRDKIESIYRKKLTLSPVELEIESRDQLLIKNAVKIVLENLSDSSMNVEKLAKKLNISRVQLYKRMVAILGKAPAQFIRDIRLEQAAQLLEKSQLNVSEVAFKVGFSDRKYLSTYFKKKYGQSPSSFQKNHQKA